MQAAAAKQEIEAVELEPNFRLIVAAIPDACIVVDSHFNYVYINPAAEEFSGISAAEAIGQPLSIAAAGDPDGKLEKYREVMRTGVPILRDDVFLDGAFGARRFRMLAIKMGEGLGVVWTDITSEKSSEGRLRAAQVELESLTAHLIHVREEDRKHIAREMHDELGQILTALDMELRWINRKYAEAPPEMHERIDGMLELSTKAIASVKRMASELRPGILDDLGLKAAMEWFVADFSRRTAIAASVRVEAREELVGDRAAIDLFRITQEALTNVARHASASRAEVSLREAGGAIVLEIGDDGVGIPRDRANDERSFGLMGIRERARELGGEVAIRGDEGRGTLVYVSIPLPPSGSLP